MKTFILASRSPRRKDLLETLLPAGSFVCRPALKEEIFPEGDLDAALLAVAQAKAEEIREHNQEAWILSADTIVVHEGRILGKPASKEEASAVLKSLSGQWHEVKTGMVLLTPTGRQDCKTVETTRVHFRGLDQKEIEAYVARGSCLDKAGSYGIQETDFVDALEGSWSNVVGLPLETLRTWLRSACLL